MFENRVYLMVALVAYTLFVSYIGYRNRRSQNSEDYFLASRNLPTWLLAITFIASWWGGGSAIDLVDHAFNEGLSSFWIYGVPVLLATGLMYLIASKIRNLKTISQPEIMELRYDKCSAFMLSIFIIIFMTIGASIQVIVIGQFFQSYLGISYVWGAVIGTSMVLLYSLFGGFRGVVLTDLIQFMFFLFSGLFLFIFTYNKIGGFSEINGYADSLNRVGYTSIFHNLGDKMAYIITFGTSWMVQANVWQRISAARDGRSAKRMMLLSFVAFIPLYLMVTYTGMFSIALFDTVPEGGVVSNILSSLSNPMISGLIFIGLCSAIMSTMDSMFNTGALSVTIDIYKRHINPNGSERRYVIVGRLATLLIATLSLLIALEIKSILTISWIGADFIATGAFVPLVLGFAWKRANAKAALYTMVFGLLFSSYNFAVALGADLPVAWEIASTTQAIIGICASLILFVTITFITSKK